MHEPGVSEQRGNPTKYAPGHMCDLVNCHAPKDRQREEGVKSDAVA